MNEIGSLILMTMLLTVLFFILFFIFKVVATIFKPEMEADAARRGLAEAGAREQHQEPREQRQPEQETDEARAAEVEARERQQRERNADEARRRADEAGARERQRKKQEEQDRSSKNEGSGMNIAQAFEILDLSMQATETEVRVAYARLMKRVHPDVGGSVYLSKQLNIARNTALLYLKR